MVPSHTPADRTFMGDRKTAWEGFLHCQAAMVEQLARELDEAGEIPLSTYDILVQLSQAGGRLRLRDLVHRVVLSQPGLSRKVARLEQQGLLDRLPDPADGRGVQVRISRSGRAALRSAAQVHVSGIVRMFASKIDDDEAATLATVFRRLVSELAGEPAFVDVGSDGPPGDGPPDDGPRDDGPRDDGAPDDAFPTQRARPDGRRASAKNGAGASNGPCRRGLRLR